MDTDFINGELLLVWLCLGLLAAASILQARVLRRLETDVEFRKIVAHEREEL